MTRTNRELKLIFAVIVALFAVFLAGPILILLGKSLWDGGLTRRILCLGTVAEGISPGPGQQLRGGRGLGGSGHAAGLSAGLWGALHQSAQVSKRLITSVATLPMFLPTITYGFAIIYSFGKQGLITRLLGGSCLIFTAFSA